MEKVKITQVKSGIGRTARQKRTLEALGFKRLNQSLEVQLTPSVSGMVEAVKHLLKVEKI